MKLKEYPYISGVPAKLFLYISIASLSSLLSDLSHYTCSHDHWSDISPIRWVTIILNFIVQALIAWRAFIDGSVERLAEREREDEKARELDSHH